MKNLVMATVTTLILVSAANLQGAIIIADAQDDWDTYSNDGIDEDGSSVTAGSSDDAPQQGHADTDGSGSWEYGTYDSGNSFSPYSTWDTGDLWWDNASANYPRIGQLSVHPGKNDVDTARRWVSGVSGTVTVSGYVQRPWGEGANRTGIIALFFLDGAELTDERIEIDSAYDHNVYEYSFDVSVADGTTLDFVVDAHSGDTSGDSTHFASTITIPEPTTLALLGLGVVSLLGRRRRRA